MTINKNDHQRENALIFYQILSIKSLRNVRRSVWRICMLIKGLKGGKSKQGVLPSVEGT